MVDRPASPQTLQPRVVPVVATDTKFCPTTNSKLLLSLKRKKNSATSDVQIRDASTTNLKFSCLPSKNKWKHIFHEKVLREEEDIGEEFLLRRKLVSISNQSFLLKGDRTLCSFTNCSVPVSNKAKILAEFKDAVQKRKDRLLVLKGTLESRNAVVYLGDPKKEGERILATITQKGEKRPSQGEKRLSQGATSLLGKDNKEKGEKEEYLLEIAGGVDLFVILGMCMVLLEEKYRDPKPVVVPLK